MLLGRLAWEEASAFLGTGIQSVQELPGAEEQIKLLVPPMWLRPAPEYMPTGLTLHPLWPHGSDTFTLLVTLNPEDPTFEGTKHYKVLAQQPFGTFKGKYLRFINSLGTLYWNKGPRT